MKAIHEVHNDFTDDGYTYIDVYHSSDENASGKTVAIVCNETSKVFFIDNMYRNEQVVKEAIDEVLNKLKPLSKPLTREELEKLKDENGNVTVRLIFDIEGAYFNSLDSMNDEVSERITDSECGLTDISYNPVGILLADKINNSKNSVIMEITGNVSDFLNEEL